MEDYLLVVWYVGNMEFRVYNKAKRYCEELGIPLEEIREVHREPTICDSYDFDREECGFYETEREFREREGR